ncbi:MAG: glycosyl hydrolase [Arcticibacter sp.]
MFYNKKKKILTAAMFAAIILAGADLEAQTPVWPAVKKEMKPWTRWWWMGNAVNETDIKASLTSFQQAGIGGVEIAPIYGVKGMEDKYISYLSSPWMKMLNATVNTADSLNMGVDLTNGTGWPFGGPQVSLNEAASRLIVQTYQLKAGARLAEKISVKEQKQESAPLQFLTAYGSKGEIVQLIDKVRADGTLNWSPKTGTWELYAVFNGKTRQMVKRSSPGGEGYTLNHFSHNALNVYLKRFDDAFQASPPNIRAFYNDSYEVYGADWSAEFLDLFQKNRGYDFRQYIREFVSKEPTVHQARLKSDYRETMSEMLLTNFTEPWTSWARKHKAITRNQAHGSPGNLLDLYAAVDIPECETFGSSFFPIPGLRRDSADIRNVDPDPVMLKFASSAAHVAGHNLVSCETFTWLTEHFKTSLSQCKPEVEQVFLSGINHVFFHGTTYSPPKAEWPGWLFYASVDFTPANSFWQHMPGLTSYITRVQSVLQSGKSDNEILIYWPVFDAWNKAQGRDMPLKVHDIDEWLHPTPFYKNVKDLQQSGYSVDFVSDHLLSKSSVRNGLISTAAGASPYRVLVVPEAKMMPLETLQQILALAREGATVIFQQLPADVPGLGELEKRQALLKETLSGLSFTDGDSDIRQLRHGKGKLMLSANIQKALLAENIEREALTDAGLAFIRRQDGTNKYYYLVNHTDRVINQDLPLNAQAEAVVLMDPQSGYSGLASFKADGSNRILVKVQMKPGEAMIVKASTEKLAGIEPWRYLDQPKPQIAVDGKWRLHFANGGPVLPSDRTLNTLADWTSLGDADLENFSGAGEYSITFQVPKAKASEYILDLGAVHESARVWVNGQDAGILWSIPHQARIGKYLRPGKNTLRIEVTNLMANRIRYMDKKGIEWKKFHDINVVDINYKPLNASNWKVQPSGLAGPITITPY